MLVTINVQGLDPAPQGSKTYYGNGRMAESCKRVDPWRDLVTGTASQQMRTQGVELLIGAVSVTAEFRFARPKSHLTSKGALKNDAPLQYTVKKNDLDKVCRSTLDALTGIAFEDDSKVIHLLANKRYCRAGEEPGAAIIIKQM